MTNVPGVRRESRESNNDFVVIDAELVDGSIILKNKLLITFGK